MALVGSLLHDVRHCLRGFARDPIFFAFSICIIALAIAANTAMFAILNAVLLRPLPYEDADRLVRIWAVDTKRNVSRLNVSGMDFEQIAEQTQTLRDLVLYKQWSMNLTGCGYPSTVSVAWTTPGFFELLGVAPVVGRAFLKEESQVGQNRVAVISSSLWSTCLNSQKSLTDKYFRMDGETFKVVGVAPPGFAFPASHTQIWIPLVLQPSDARSGDKELIARLRETASVSQVQSELNTISTHLSEAHPQRRGRTLRAVPLQEAVVGESAPVLFLLFGATVLVLLIACANLGSLLLARSTSRLQEIEIRRALGATRSHVIRQLLTENLLLAFIGGVIGLILLWWPLSFFTFLLRDNLMGTIAIRMEWPVLAFNAAMCLVTGILIGGLPAWQLSSWGSQTILRESSSADRQVPPVFRRERLRSLLLTAEVCLSVVLLVSAGLLIRSLSKLLDVELGFDAKDVAAMWLILPENTYHENAAHRAFFREVLKNVSGLPGVEAAAISNNGLFTGAMTTEVEVEQPEPQSPWNPVQAEIRTVSEGYAKALRIRVLEGRFLSRQDTETAHPVIVIDQSLARRLWPGESPLGKRVLLGGSARRRTAASWEVVGVVDSTRDVALTSDPKPSLYVSYLQVPFGSAGCLLVRSAVEGPGLFRAIREQVRKVDADQPVADYKPLQQLVGALTIGPKRRTLLLGTFSCIALLIASVGVYGVVSYSVSRRGYEIGIRLALGAPYRHIINSIMHSTLKQTVLGALAGCVGGVMMGRYLGSLLFAVTPFDIPTFVVSVFVVVGTALLAAYIPARRAVKTDPLQVLRHF